MVDVVANHVGPVGYSYNTIVPFNEPSYFHNCNSCPSGCQIQDFTNQPQVCPLSLLSSPPPLPLLFFPFLPSCTTLLYIQASILLLQLQKILSDLSQANLFTSVFSSLLITFFFFSLFSSFFSSGTG